MLGGCSGAAPVIAHTCTHTHIHTHAHTYTHAHTQTYTHMHTRAHTRAHTHTSRRGKVLALELLKLLLENTGPVFQSSDLFTTAIRQHLCASLLRNRCVCVCAVCLFLCFVLLVCVYVLVFVCTRVFVLSWVFFAFMDFYLVAIVPFLLAWLAGLFTLGASKPRVHERYMWMSNHARPC